VEDVGSNPTVPTTNREVSLKTKEALAEWPERINTK